MIETQALTKKFREKTAVDSLSIHIADREIYAFLGLNGAGKTTTIKMLCGLLPPTSGDATVGGFRLSEELNRIKAISAVSPQESAISEKLTVRENILLMAQIYGIDRQKSLALSDSLMEEFHLTENADKRAGTLSGGFQRRLSIVMALVSEPQILYLDEPTLGLDVLARRDLWKLIRKLREKMTVVLTTHYLEEVEALADTIGIIKNGHLLFEGNLSALYEASGKDNIEDAFISLSEEML